VLEGGDSTRLPPNSRLGEAKRKGPFGPFHLDRRSYLLFFSCLLTSNTANYSNYSLEHYGCDVTSAVGDVPGPSGMRRMSDTTTRR